MHIFYDTEFLDDGDTINLISIGMIREDGAEYHAVHAYAPWDRIKQHPWLRANVVPQLPPVKEWKPRYQIAAEVSAFVLEHPKPELWAWFSAYDHVVLSQLFGRMLDMPTGMPQYTNDLRSLINWTGVKELPKEGPGAHNALNDARLVKIRHEHVMATFSSTAAERPASVDRWVPVRSLAAVQELSPGARLRAEHSHRHALEGHTIGFGSRGEGVRLDTRINEPSVSWLDSLGFTFLVPAGSPAS